MEIFNKILESLAITFAMYVIAVILTLAYQAIRFIVSSLKIKIDSRKRISKFYKLINDNPKALNPFLEDLEYVIHDLVKNLSSSEINIAMSKYHFYRDILQFIIDNKKVSKDDMVLFAEMHREYCDLVKTFKRINNDKFYEENKFFDINLN